MAGESPESRREIVVFKGRIERLHTEQKSLKEDEKTVWDEMKAKGYEVKHVKSAMKIVEAREKDAEAYDQAQKEIGMYVEIFTG